MAVIPVGINFRVTGASAAVSSLNSSRKAIALYGQQVQTTARQTRGATGGVNTFTSALSAPSNALKVLGTSVVQVGRQVENLGRTFTRVGLSMSFLFTLPILGAVQQSISAFSDFEEEIVKISTLVGLPNEAIDQLVNGFGEFAGIKDIALETGTDLNELAEAAFFATSAQLSVADSLDLVSLAAKGSQIGLGSIDSLTRAAAGAMQAFGIDAEEAMDTLLLAVRFGSIEVDQFAGVLGRVGGIAAAAGIDFQDATAFISAFTLSGVSASEATTALRATLTTIIRPSQAGRDALAEIDVSAEAVQKSLGENGLGGTLVFLRQKFEEAGVPFTEFFRNIRGLAGVSFVTSQEFADNYARIATSIEEGAEQGGVVLTEFQKVTQTTGFQVDLLRAQFQVLATEIGAILAPAFNAMIGRLVEVVSAIRQFAQENPRLVAGIIAIGTLVAVMGPVLAVMGLFLTSIGGIITAIGTLISFLGALISPIGIVIGAVVALAAAIAVPLIATIQKLIERSDTSFGEMASRAFSWGKNIILQLAKGIIAGITFVVRALRVLGQVISDFLKPGSPPKLLPDLPDWGMNAMQEFLNGMTNADFVGTFNDLAGRIQSAFENNIDKLTEGDVGNILDIRDALANAFLEIERSGVNAPFDDLVDSLGLADSLLTDYIGTMLELAAVTEQVKDIQQEIADIQQQFEENTAPINDELDAIAARRQEVKDNLRLDELRAIAADATAPALAKELALMEIREIQLQRQLRAQEELKDEAVSEAEERLTAAEQQQKALEEQAALQEALLDTQQNQLDLFKELKEVIEEVNDSVSKLDDSIGSLADTLDFDPEDLGFGGGAGGGGLGGLEDLLDEEFDVPSLADIIGEGFTEGGQAIIDSFNGFLEDLQGPIDDLIAEWDLLGETWLGVYDTIVNNDIGELISNSIEKLPQPIQDVITAFTDLEEPTDRAGDAFDRMSDNSIPKLIGALERLNDSAVVRGSRIFLVGLARGIGVGLGNLFRQALLSTINFTEVLFNLGTDLAADLADLFANLATGEPGSVIVESLLKLISDFNLNLFALIFTSIANAGAAIVGVFDKEFASKIRDGISILLDFVNMITSSSWEEAVGIWRTYATIIRIGFVAWAQRMWARFDEWFEGILLRFYTWALDQVAALVEWREDMTQKFSEWWEETSTSWGEFWEGIIERFAQWVLDIIADFEGFRADAKAKFLEIWENIKTTITDFIEEAETLISNGLQSLFDIIDSWEPPSLYEVGVNLVQGFINGIQSLAGQAVSAISNMVNGSQDAAEEGLQTKSPSKVFERIAQDVALGYIGGLARAQPAVAAATAGMVTSGIGTVAAPAIAGRGGNTTANVNFGGVNINNGMDSAVFDARVRAVLASVLNGR